MVLKAASSTSADKKKQASFLRDDKNFLNESLGYMGHVVKDFAEVSAMLDGVNVRRRGALWPACLVDKVPLWANGVLCDFLFDVYSSPRSSAAHRRPREAPAPAPLRVLQAVQLLVSQRPPDNAAASG